MTVDKFKSIIFGLMFLSLGMIMTVPGAYADTIQAGNWIKLADVPGHGDTGGGEFALSVSTTKAGSYSYQFNTFCLEADEYFNWNTPLYVSGVTKTAYNGGSNTDAGDPLDARTAYLYYHFRMGDLHSLAAAYQYNTDAGANDLQKAIWFLEEENLGVTNYLVTLANNASANDLQLALAHVAVLNLTDGVSTVKQDQLALVPEPTTLLLLGFGLIGLVGYRKSKA